MSIAKAALACAVAGLCLSACGSTAKPVAGTISPTATTVGHAKIDDPLTKHTQCILQHKLSVSAIGRTELQINTPGGPKVEFTPTPGEAQADQFSGRVPGAEVIGSALLYPNQASDHVLQIVEDCLAVGVKG